MPVYQGGFRLSFGERLSLWWPDANGFIGFSGSPPAGEPDFRNSGSIYLSSPTDGSGFSAALVLNEVFGSLTIVSESEALPPPSFPISVAAAIGNVVVNDGRIAARSAQDGYGVSVSRLLLNRGDISVEVGEFGAGARMRSGGDFHNSGSIVVRAGVQAIGVEMLEHGAHFNSGLISAFATSPAGIGIAWFSNAYYTDRSDLVNTGVIEGDYAYYAYAGGTLATVRGIFDVVTNAAGGQMRGAISTAFGTDVVVNHGIMTGPVLLGHGADLFISTGTQFDAVEGQDGTDTLIGGGGSDYLFGGEGADVIFGGAGDDIIGGGRGQDLLDGGEGFDTLYFLDSTRGVTVDLGAGTSTGTGADRIRNFEGVLGSIYGDRITGSSGGDVLEGLAGADVIDGGKGADIIVGGTGDDRLTGGLGADTFVFTTGDGHDVIEDFEAVDTLSIHGYAAPLSIVQSGADVHVVLSATDTIVLRNLQVADLTPGRLVFSATPLAPEQGPSPTQPVLTGENFIFEADERMVLTNPGLASAGGWVLNAAVLLYDAQDSQTIRPSVWNAGEIRYETTSNSRTVTSIWNASTTGPGAETFHNQSSGVISVVNHGSAMTYGAMHVANNAFNDGRIEATGGGDAFGVTSTSFVNTGHIAVDAGGHARGIDSTGNGVIWNTGTIEVHGHERSAGLYFLNATNAVNTGTIRVTDDTAALDSMGVSYSFTITTGGFINTGVIEADYAIYYGSASDYYSEINTTIQTLRNGGELRGIVSLSANRDAFYNTGLITGEVRLGQGDDLFDGRGGTQAAGVLAGDGHDTVYGGAGIDRINGGAGVDTISGGGGDDVLTGGAGADRFIFAVGDGQDVITDFNVAEDQMRFIGYSRWQSVEQVGADTLVRLSATDSILLKNVTASTVTSAWFNYDALPYPPSPITAPVNQPRPTAPPTAPTATDFTHGTAAGETLTGGAGVDRLLGEGGDDVLNGGDGDDILIGGDGTDRLTGGVGKDILYGGAGADIFIINDDTIDGAASDRIIDFNPAEGDLIYLTGTQAWFLSEGVIQFGQRFITLTDIEGWQSAIRYGTPPSGLIAATGTGLQFTGTAAADVRLGTAMADVLNGEGGLDVLDGAAGDDVLNGGDGDDILHGGAGTDNLTGGAGDDTLRGGEGVDTLSGGDGQDTADYGDARSAVRVDLTLTGAQDTLGGGLDTLSGLERLAGSAYNDTLLGTTGANVLYGAGGDDRLEGRGGADFLDGGAGVDTAVFAGARSAYTLSWTDDAADGVTITGPDGVSRAVNVEWLQFSDGTVSAARSVFTFNGAAAGEASTGTNFHDVMNGGGGDDVLNGLNGDDVIHGGDGDDRLNAGAGSQQLFGDVGDDVITVRPAAVTGTNATPSRPLTYSLLDGGDGNDIIDFQTSGIPVDRVTVLGGNGNDVISVRGAYELVVDGGAGDDIIVVEESGAGAQFTGGGGQDTFRLVQTNPEMPTVRPGRITDFVAGDAGDRIDVWPYFAALFPDVPPGSNLFEMGLLRIVGRGGWVEIEAMSGPNGYFDLVISLVDVSISDLTLANFTGITSGGLGPYGAAGTADDDIIRGNGDANYLSGNAGADILYGEGGNDLLYGNGGPDVLYGGDGDDYLHVGNGRDSEGVVIGAGDFAYGGAGNDTMLGGSYGANFYGGTGDDHYSGYDIAHEFADEGVDTVFASHSRTLEDNVENLLFSWSNDPWMGSGNNFNDLEGVGNAVNNRIVGADGRDTLSGLEGDDRLEGLDGADILRGGNGDDTLVGGNGNDALDGGAGLDTAIFVGARAAFTITTANGVTSVTGPGGTDTLTGVERLRFSDGLFDITGAALPGNEINGTAQADTLTGTADTDLINGGDGDDVITGGAGDDQINGGAGRDTAVFAGARSTYTVSFNNGVVTVSGADGVDTLAGVEYLRFNDMTLIAAPNGGRLITGTAAADTLTGTSAADEINGGDGDDVLTGGVGNDALNGGAGLDTAVYSTTGGPVRIETTGGVTTVTAADGTDTLTGIERVRVDGLELTVGAITGAHVLGGATRDVLSGSARNDNLRGRDGDDTLAGGGGNDLLDGGNGVDTADYSGAAAGVTAQLNTGQASNDGDGGVDTFASIENLTGSAFNDVLVGDAAANVLRGGAGYDVLLGLAGDDVIYGGAGAANEMYGGDGNDRYIAEAIGDTVVEQAGEGVDLVETSLARFRLSANVENLTYTGTAGFEGQGNAGDNVIRGTGARDVLLGFGGNDILYGGAGAANELYGGSGDDYYVVEAGDTIVEAENDGIDTVESRLDTFVLRVNVENLIYGGTGNFTGVGNASNNLIIGGAGDDRLVGGGGVDTLNGGDGRDMADYSTAAAGVTVRLDRHEASNDGDGASDVLTGIEDVRGSAFSDLIYGDAGSNVLWGGAGRDVLIGFGGDDVIHGGTGDANEMYGGDGNDRYVVEADGDTIVEQAGEGVDLVETGLARFRLSAHVENLTYTGTTGFEGQGNAGDNVIRGTGARDVLLGFDGNDILYGGAGAANELYGGAGDDYYVVEAGDTIVEGLNGGSDSVESRLNVFYLGANIENLFFGGVGNFVGTGNSLNNLIIGGAGDDVLAGGGGSDQIQGGGGHDRLLLRGVQADYTITAEGAGWRIIDNTAGRDGSILATSIEVIEFGDRSTRDLTPPAGALTQPVAPSADTVKTVDAGPQVLPGEDDGFVLVDGPEVLPHAPFDKAGDGLPLVQPDDGRSGTGLLDVLLEDHAPTVHTPDGHWISLDNPSDTPFDRDWLF